MEVRNRLSSVYDAALACDLYTLNRDPNLTYDVLLPLISMVVKKHFPGLERTREDDMISDAMGSLYIQLLRRKYNHHEWNERHFTTFFWNVIKRQLYDSINAINKSHYPPGMLAPPHMIHPIDVENHMYLEQLPGFVRDIVTKRFRFTGRELQACMYVLDRLLTGSQIVAAYLKRIIGVDDPEFFVTYVVVLIRSSIYELKIQGGVYVFRDIFYSKYSYE